MATKPQAVPTTAGSIIGGEVPQAGAMPLPTTAGQPVNQPTNQPRPTLGPTDWTALIDQAGKQIDTSSAGDAGPEISQPSTQIPKKMSEMFVPGYQMLSYNSAYLEPFKYNYNQVVQMQRNLALAGYLPVDRKGNVRVDSLGFYDQSTRSAMEQLLVDSRDSGWNPRDILKYRMDIARGRKPHQPNTASAGNMSDMSPEDHLASLDDAYMEVWGRKAPPGYSQQLFNFNPDELKAYERAKLTYQNSDVAQESQNRILGMLQQLFTGQSPTGSATPPQKAGG